MILKIKRYKTQDTILTNVIVGVFLFSIFYLLSSVQLVNAVSISPLKHTVVVDAGASQDVAFTVTNNSDTQKNYVMSVEGFLIDPVHGRAVFGQGSLAQSWVTFPSGSSFTLAPGVQREVISTITVPVGEVPQTYYLAVFAQEVQEGGTIALGARVGTLVFLTIGGVITENMQIEYITPSAFVSVQPPTIDVGLRNAGTVISPYVGEVIVHTFSGLEVYRAPVSVGVSRVYAGMRQQQTVPLGSLSWRAFGPLRVTVAVQYGVQKQVVYGATTFWHLPWWSWIASFGIIGVCIWFFVMLKRRAS